MRGALALVALLVVAAPADGCELLPPDPALPATLHVINGDDEPVDVRWSGASSGELRLDPCSSATIDVAFGATVVDLRTDAGRTSLPVDLQPEDVATAVVIGIDADGSAGLGRPPDAPACRNE